MRFTDIRARITEGMKFKEYIMWVSETDKPGVYAYDEVQPLVRCKDCKHHHEQKCFAHFSEGVEEAIIFPAPDNFFCAWGERVGSE